MRNALSMVFILTLITSVCGLGLGALYSGTQERIEEQLLKNKKLPAVQEVLSGADNDLLASRLVLVVSEKEKRLIFTGMKKSRPFAVALDDFGQGYGGRVGVMLGIDVQTDKLTGIRITTHSETPGVGSRCIAGAFTDQFTGKDLESKIAVKADGGKLDAVTGATVTSRAVCTAVTGGLEFYNEHRREILELVGMSQAGSGQRSGVGDEE